MDYTSKGLRKPTGPEAADVADINFNADRINSYGMGAFECTSGTRPAAPWAGLQIFETDTKCTLVWDGTAWRISRFSQAAGLANVTSPTAAMSSTVAVVFPVGRFTVAPEVFAQHVSTAALVDGFIPVVSDITAIGFNLRLYRVNGGVWSTAQPVQWHAVQMLSTAAAG